MFGGDPRAGGLRLRDERLEASLFGRCRLSVFLTCGSGSRFRCTRGRERGLQLGGAVAMLPVLIRQREPAFLDHSLELGQLRLSLLFLRGLRFALPGRRPALDGVLIGERSVFQVFGDGLFELIARRPLTFLAAHAVHLRALDLALELAHLRLVAEVQQQRVDPVGMVVERHALNEHRSRLAAGDHEMALERGGAVRPAASGELLPPGPFGLGDAIGELSVEDGAERADGEKPERGIVAGEQGAVEAHPDQAGRLPLEKPAQVCRVSREIRRAAFSPGQDCALLPTRAGTWSLQNIGTSGAGNYILKNDERRSLLAAEPARDSLPKRPDGDRFHEDGFVFPQHRTRREELVGIAGKVEHPGLRVTVVKPPRELVAAHPGHHHVEDKEVEPGLGVHEPERLWSIGSRYDLVAVARQRPLGELPNPFVVVHDQDAAG